MAIKGTDVNLRGGPNKKTASVAKLNDGNLVEVMYYKIQKDGRWYFVHTLNGQSGWVFGNYLRNRRSF
ncbi:MAG: SH3 domain-containing protein [Fretibacterium sp.]|nr:SH3 domain-containing protein [Fretibacterium sp.]